MTIKTTCQREASCEKKECVSQQTVSRKVGTRVERLKVTVDDQQGRSGLEYIYSK